MNSPMPRRTNSSVSGRISSTEEEDNILSIAEEFILLLDTEDDILGIVEELVFPCDPHCRTSFSLMQRLRKTKSLTLRRTISSVSRRSLSKEEEDNILSVTDEFVLQLNAEDNILGIADELVFPCNPHCRTSSSLIQRLRRTKSPTSRRTNSSVSRRSLSKEEEEDILSVTDHSHAQTVSH